MLRPNTKEELKIKEKIEKKGRFTRLGASSIPVHLMDDGPVKKIYTQEENYRAYKLFSMVDIDGGGSITLRELKRVMMGSSVRYFSSEFSHPDCGIVWGIDEEQCVCIESIESHSLASNDPTLTKNMRIYSVNENIIPVYNQKALHVLNYELIKLHNSSVTLSFYEPVIVVSQFTCMLDIEVENRSFSIKIPIGAVYNLDIFKRTISQLLIKVHPSFKHIKIGFVERTRQIFFQCDRFEFRFLFSSGPNVKFSCRYILGFSDKDMPYANYHIGQAMLIDLNLGISESNLDILMEELFSKFDADGSGEFEFEEFRDFFIKYLDTEESLNKLRNYAQYRFRDIELEKTIAKVKVDHANKMERRDFTKEKYKHTIEDQVKRYRDDSLIDIYGMRRRIYKHRTAQRPKTVVHNLIKDAEVEILVTGEADKEDSIAEPESTDISVTSILKKRKHRTDHSISFDSTADSSVTQLEAHEKYLMKKARRKEKLLRQTERRKKILKQIFEANKQLNKAEKSNAKKAEERMVNIHMFEVVTLFKQGLAQQLLTDNTEANNTSTTINDININRIIASPAVSINDKVFGPTFHNDDIDLVDLTPSQMNPAGHRYFFIRQNKEIQAAYNPSVKIGDSSIRHPAFFTADYIRQPERHSAVGLGVAQLISSWREDGVIYRARKGIHKNHTIPPDDIIPLRESKKVGTKVRFNEEQIRQFEVKIKGLQARVTVLSIKVHDLKSAHIVEVNSPFVTVVCGEWRFTTEINSYAGSQAEWDDLNWTLRLHAEDTFQAIVYSGTVSNYQHIGKAFITAPDFIKIPIKKNGQMYIKAPLYDTRKKPKQTGWIEFQLFTELGQEWDWHIFNYQMKVNKEESKKHNIEKFSKTFSGEFEELDYPLGVTISFVSLFDLKSIHVFSKNRPYILFNCGKFNYKLDYYDSDIVNDDPIWQNLSVNAKLITEESNLIFVVNSGSSFIGRFSISGEELLKLNRSNDDCVNIYGDLSSFSEYTGKIFVKCILDNKREVRSVNSKINRLKLILPAIIDINSISLLDIPTNNLFATNKNSFKLNCTCGDFKEQTIKTPSSAINNDIVWDRLNWQIPFKDGMDIKILLFSQSKEFGSVVINSMNLCKIEKDDNGVISYIDDIYNGKALVGRIQLLISSSTEGFTYTVDKVMHDLSLLVDRKPLISGYSHITNDIDISEFQNEAVERSKSKSMTLDASSSIIDDVNMYPFRLKVTDIIATDLQAAHYFSKNSPHINIACGSKSESSKDVANAGAAAIWNGLNFTYFVHKVEKIRIAVWSKSTCIGFYVIEPIDLLKCSVDDNGVRELFINIYNNNSKITGKLAISFTLDNYKLFSIPSDIEGIITPQSLQSPILMTIYTVSLISLKSVHYLAKNSPIVKFACGTWRNSTSVKENVGNNAKWENLVWSLVIKDESVVKISVLSGSIVIGILKVSFPDLIAQVPDKNGLSEIEGYLSSDGAFNKGTAEEKGMIRITYANEPNPDPISNENDLSDDDLSDEESQINDDPDSKFGKVKVYAILVSNLRSIHTLISNSPFLKLQCGDYKKTTEPQYFAGDSANWLDLSISFFMAAEADLVITVMSGQVVLGSAKFSYTNIFESEMDNFGLHLVKSSLFSHDNQIMGRIVIKLELLRDEKTNFSRLEERYHIDKSKGNKNFKFSDMNLPMSSMITIPFVLRLEKILAFDIIDDSSSLKKLIDDKLILTIKYDEWVKATNAISQDNTSAVWTDNEWCWIIFDKEKYIDFMVISNSVELGKMRMTVVDLTLSPKNKNGQIELNGYLNRGIHAVGKLILLMTASPYVSPAEESLSRKNSMELMRSMKEQKIVGYMRIISVSVIDLIQVYAIFRNSPKVKLSFGSWTRTTSAAVDAGSNYTWENLDFGKVPIRETLSLSVKVYSGNEIVGSLEINWKELLKILNDYEGKNSISISGDLFDGLIKKGKIDIVCLPVIDEDNEIDDSPMDIINDEPSVSNSESIDEMNTLSLSTITPVSIDVKVLGLSVYNLSPMNSVYKNSPQVTMNSGTWNVKTSVAASAGDSANWILKNNSLWSFSMKGVSFLKITVISSGSIIGSVLISSREIISVHKDSQGLTYLTRPIEKNDKLAGNVKICCIVKANYFEDDLVTKSADKMKKALDNKLLLNNSLSVSIPFTMIISQITALDFIPKNYFTPNFIYVELTCNKIKKLTKNSSRPSGRYGNWSDLDWRFDIFDPTMFIKFSVHSGLTTLGTINVTPNDLLSVPRTSQGFTELSLTLKKDSTMSGKLQICLLLTPFVSPEERKLFLVQEELKLESHINNLQANATLSIEVISMIDISLTYTSATAIVTVGSWSSSTSTAPNRKETIIWGNLEWNSIPLFERTNLNVLIKSGDEEVGSMDINSLDIVNTPPDPTGFIVIHGDLLNGLVSKGKLSLGCKIRLIGTPTISELPFCSTVEQLLKSETVIVHSYDLRKVSISSISAINLRSVHKVGKNSPSIKVEYNGFKFQSKSIPYGGANADWNDLMWTIELNRIIKIKLTVVSGSAVIGTLQFSSEDIILLTKDDEFRGCVVLEKIINHQDNVAGTIFIYFFFERSKAENYNNILDSQSNEELIDDIDTRLEESVLQNLSTLEREQLSLNPQLKVSGTVEMDNISLMSQSSFLNLQRIQSNNPTQDTGRQLTTRSNASRPKTSRGDEVDNIPSGQISIKSSSLQSSSNIHTNDDSSSRDFLSIDRTSYSQSLTATSTYIDHSSGSRYNSTSLDSSYTMTNDSSKYSTGSVSSGNSFRSDSYSENLSSLKKSIKIPNVSPLLDKTNIDSELYSYKDILSNDETIETSRSNYSDVSSSSRWSEDTSNQYESSRPTSSSSRYSDFSSATKTSMISTSILEVNEEDDEQSNNDFKSTSNLVVSDIAEIDEPIIFNLDGLHWKRNDADTIEITHFFARIFFVGVLKNVVKSLTVLENGGDFIPKSGVLDYSDGINNMILSLLPYPDLIQQFSLDYTLSIFQICFNKIVGKFARLENKNNNSSTLTASVIALNNSLRFPETNYKPFIPEFDPADPFLHELPNSRLIPIRVRMTVLDFMGLDLSGIDKRIIPKRPYLTACKPFGNWAAETGPAWTNIDNLKEDEMIVNWFNLNGKWKWEPFILRVGQALVFDIHDGGSGLLLAKSRLTYEYIMSKILDSNDVLTVYAEFDIANEYGGGKLGSVLRFHVDTTVNIYNRPKKSVEYWDKHRIHHWKHFPLAPISTGVVRQRYREISEEYDKQKIIHPCFFGFKMRWRGNAEDESRFIHPMFVGFNLAKKPLVAKAASELDKDRGKLLTNANPFKWDPLAAAAGRCLICTNGVAGCPRCFMLPVLPDGTPTKLIDYAYNPILEREKALELDKILVRLAAKQARKMNNLKLSEETGEFEEGSVGSLAIVHQASYKYYNENGELLRKTEGIHTTLTNYQSIKAYGSLVSKLTVVYVKVLPAGYVKRFIVRSTDSIFHLYNMFNSHSHFGTCHTSMIILPTISGMFELHPEITFESDLLLADARGKEILGTFGFTENRGVVILLYFANYKPLYTASLLSSYFDKNINYKLDLLPTYDYISKLPKELSKDPVQSYLKTIIIEEYRLQQAELKQSFLNRGLAFRSSSEAKIEQAIKKERSIKDMGNQDKLASTLRLEAQMKNFSPEQRKKALKALKKREKSKKRSALVDVEKEKIKKASKSKKINKKTKADNDDVSIASEESSRVSLSDVNFNDSASEDTDGSSEVDSESENESEDEEDDEEDEDGNDSDGSIESTKREIHLEANESDENKVEATEVSISNTDGVITNFRSNSSDISLNNIVLNMVNDNNGSLFYIVDDAVSTNQSYSTQSWLSETTRSSTFNQTYNTMSTSRSSQSYLSEGHSSISNSLITSARSSAGSYYNENGTFTPNSSRTNQSNFPDSTTDGSITYIYDGSSVGSRSYSYFHGPDSDSRSYLSDSNIESVNSKISDSNSRVNSLASFDRKSDVTTEYRMISPSVFNDMKQSLNIDSEMQSFGTIYSDLGQFKISSARSTNSSAISYYSSSRPSTNPSSEDSRSTGGLYTYRSWISGSTSDGWNSARSGYSSRSSSGYSTGSSGFSTARSFRSENESRPSTSNSEVYSDDSRLSTANDEHYERPSTSSSHGTRPSTGSSEYSEYSSRPTTSSTDYSSRPTTSSTDYNSRPSTSSSSVYTDSRPSSTYSDRSEEDIDKDEEDIFSRDDSLYSAQINFINDNNRIPDDQSLPFLKSNKEKTNIQNEPTQVKLFTQATISKKAFAGYGYIDNDDKVADMDDLSITSASTFQSSKVRRKINKLISDGLSVSSSVDTKKSSDAKSTASTNTMNSVNSKNILKSVDSSTNKRSSAESSSSYNENISTNPSVTRSTNYSASGEESHEIDSVSLTSFEEADEDTRSYLSNSATSIVGESEDNESLKSNSKSINSIYSSSWDRSSDISISMSEWQSVVSSSTKLNNNIDNKSFSTK